MSPKDILATAFHLLGIDAHTTVPDAQGKPAHIAGDGKVRPEVFGVSAASAHAPPAVGVLVAAFLAWMFAGLEISLFVLIHRQMTLELLGRDTPGDGRDAVVRVVPGRVPVRGGGRRVAVRLARRPLRPHAGDGRQRPVLLARSRSRATSPTDAEAMLVLRFLACLGVGGVWPNAVALVAEAWPNASRPFLAGLLGAAANVGFVLLGVIGYCFPVDGRLVAVDVPRRGVARGDRGRDPRRSCRSRRGGSRAARAATSRRAGASPLREVLTPAAAVADDPRRHARGDSGGRLGGERELARAVDRPRDAAGAAATSERRAAKRKKPDARSKAKTQITRSGGAVFGSLLGGIVASVLGRRLSYFLISLGALAVSTYIFSQLDPLHPQFQMFTFVLGFVGITYFGWLPLFLPELFPTRVRSTGTGHLVQHRARGRGGRGAVGRVPARPVLRRLLASRPLERDDLRRRDARDLVRAANDRRPAGGLTWTRSA